WRRRAASAWATSVATSRRSPPASTAPASTRRGTRRRAPNRTTPPRQPSRAEENGLLGLRDRPQAREDVPALTLEEVPPGRPDEPSARGPGAAAEHLLLAEVWLGIFRVRI